MFILLDVIDLLFFLKVTNLLFLPGVTDLLFPAFLAYDVRDFLSIRFLLQHRTIKADKMCWAGSAVLSAAPYPYRRTCHSLFPSITSCPTLFSTTY